MKKLSVLALFGIFIGLALTLFYIHAPASVLALDDTFRDFYFLIRGKTQTTNNVIIVDIDERSLHALGQWPWQRNKVAKILENLKNANVGIIGLDVVFAESDNSSPSKILRDLNITGVKAADYDKILAGTLRSTPTISGYIFVMEEDNIKATGEPNTPAVFIEKNKPQNVEFLPQPFRAILNAPLIQQSSYSSGFFNTIIDEGSGVIRSVPLAMKYDYSIYPSLAFEMVRIAMGAERIYIDYDKTGILGLVINDKKIDTDKQGRLYVNYRGGAFTFPYVSALDIYNDNFNKVAFENKFVLIGTSAIGLLDLRSTPFSSSYPGVEIHANVIDNILNADFLKKPSWIWGANVVLILFSSIFYCVFFGSFNAILLFPVFLLTLLGTLGVNYFILFYWGYIFNNLFLFLSIALSFSASLSFNYFFEARQKNAIKSKFASKVSLNIMEDLLKNTGTNILEGREKEVTVFFSDIRNFTQISEKIGSAKELIGFLNSYMDPMTEIITKQKGTVDKFIGDAIMAYWNAPLDIPNHPQMAVDAALEQLRYISVLNERISQDSALDSLRAYFQKKNEPVLNIGIGINTGLAMVGEMGSSKRSDYTVIGDSINLGSRLEALCKFYGSRLNISHFTKERLSDDYIFRFLDLVQVKGKLEPVSIYQVIDAKGSACPLFDVAQDKLFEELHFYEKAIALYKDANFKDALALFQALQNDPLKTTRKLYQIYIQRCQEFIENPPKNFNGVYKLTSKD